MDACKAFRDHHPQAQVSGRDGRMLAARTLSIVITRDDGMRPRWFTCKSTLIVLGVDVFENELADLGDIAAIRQYTRARWHDLIGGNVIAYFQQERHFQTIRQQIEWRQCMDIG